MIKLNGILPWLIVGALVVLLIWSLNTDSGEPVVIEKHTTDTLRFEKIDTITITKIVEVEKRVTDTTYIIIRDSIPVPIFLSEYQFKEDGLFEFKVKGFDVSFISANIYQKTTTQVVETTTTKTTKQSKSALFVYGGFLAVSETFCPDIGVGLSLKNKWLISGNIALYNKKPIYGVHVGYNMFN